MIPLYSLGVVSMLNLCIAFLVLQRSSRYRSTALLFGASAVTVAIWALGDSMLLSLSAPTSLWWARVLFLVAPLLTMYFLLLFALRFPDDASISGKRLVLISAPVIGGATMLILLNELFIRSIPQQGAVLNAIVVSPIPYGLYALLFAAYFAMISAVFYKKLKSAKGIRRTQIRYVFFGAFFSSLLAFSTNLFLPLIGIGELVWMGPLLTIVYMMSYTVAIARYRLFDLRRAAGRAAAYLLALGVIGLGYVLAVSVLRQWIESFLLININQEVYSIALTVLALLTFPKVKQEFDTLTHNIFFRNDYDVQDVIDLYGDALISVNGQEAIVKVVDDLSKRVFGARKVRFLFRQQELMAPRQRLLQFLDGTGLDNLTLDEIINLDMTIYGYMHREGLEFALLLKTANTNLGWLLLGEKRSGEPYDRQDIRTLNTVADEIAISLENASNYEKIAEFNRTLQKRVDEATSELRDTNKKLHALDDSKDEFISMASHQLRTPLTTIKGYISMLLDGDVGEITPKQREVLEEAFSSSQRMVYLISDFLNVSRLQTGKFELELRPTDLAAVVAQEVRQLNDGAHARKMTLEYQRPAHVLEVVLDENKIRQVIMNFMDNAVYYSRPGDTIKITLSKQGSEVVFKVIDHGIGVPASERHKLFSKFSRASNAKKQRPDGTGIGLFMARKVIVAHGGSIIFESVENKGSTFGFRLPLKD